MPSFRCLRLLLLTAAISSAALGSAAAQTAVPPAPGGAPGHAAQAGAVPAGQPRPVTLDAVVVEKRTKGPHFPIGNLQEKDFTVLDNGKPQQLVGFRAVDTVAHPDAVHVLIVVDMINTQFDRIAYMREQLGEFLRENGGKLAHPTSLAIMSENGASLLGTYTYDGNGLNAAFQKVGTDMRDIGRSAGFYGMTERIGMSLNAIRRIVAYESTQPGRKLVIVISPGWRMLPMAGVEEDMGQRDWVFNILTQMTNEIREGHVTLYSVDPLELGNRDPFFYQAFLKPVKKPQQGEFPTLALQLFAVHSGGQALTNGHDVKGQLDAAMRDAGPYYELMLAPQGSGEPNEYHEIQVRLDQPDEVARAQAGFYTNVRPVSEGKTRKSTKIAKPH
ncbi:MAG: VWA domain-containing protein [Acidobacteriota bacterium]